MFNKDYIWEWINTEGRTSHLGRVFFVPSRDHLSTCFASFPVATVQGIPGHGPKHVFCLGHLQQTIFASLTSTECVGVLPIYSNMVRGMSAKPWASPRKILPGCGPGSSCLTKRFTRGIFVSASEDKNWEQRIPPPPGHVKWWHDTKQMFGLMQDVSVWDGIPNRIFPVLQDFDRYCSVMSSSNIAKYYLLELSCFDIFEQTSCHAMSPCSGRCAPMAWDLPKSTCTNFWWTDQILHQLVCSNMVKHQKHHNNL